MGSILSWFKQDSVANAREDTTQIEEDVLAAAADHWLTVAQLYDLYFHVATAPSLCSTQFGSSSILLPDLKCSPTSTHPTCCEGTEDAGMKLAFASPSILGEETTENDVSRHPRHQRPDEDRWQMYVQTMSPVLEKVTARDTQRESRTHSLVLDVGSQGSC